MGSLRLFFALFTIWILLSPLSVCAGELVTGRYLKSDGQDIEIELNVGSPPPPLVIVAQNLPKGVEVVSSRPKLKTFDSAEGVAKWLLNKIESGRMTISMRLNRPVAKNEIGGEVRFRDDSGRMVAMTLKY